MNRVLLIIILCIPFLARGQAVYEPVTNNPVYDLLDELAALKVITINSAVKPYSRVFIANKLSQAIRDPEKLDKRQRDEVIFFLRDYSFESGEVCNLINGNAGKISSPATQDIFTDNPLAITFNSGVFKVRAMPWLGTRFMVNQNGSFIEASGGGEIFGYLTKHIGFYSGFDHIHQSQPLVNPLMFRLDEGKSWNYQDDGSVYNNEWRGGLSVGWNWGEFGIFKDRPVWGNAEHGSNILSGHPPSFPYIQLHLRPAKWIEFYSMTGFLTSNVIDSSRSDFNPGSYQVKYHRKYMSANFFTITPWRGLDISFGNSIFWSDVFKVAYLMPFSVYKSVDQTLRGTVSYSTVNASMNDDGHLFFDISSRNIKHLQLYAGLWIDDWVSSYLLDSKKHNALGWKFGICLYDLPLKDLSVGIEGTVNRPRIYQEYIPAHTYANDDYSFGNYLRDDSWELYIFAKYQPLRGLNIMASYSLAQRGGYVYSKDDYATYPLSKNLIYNQLTFALNASYYITTNVRAFIGYTFTRHAGDVQYVPAFFHGNTNTLDVGLTLGF